MSEDGGDIVVDRALYDRIRTYVSSFDYASAIWNSERLIAQFTSQHTHGTLADILVRNSDNGIAPHPLLLPTVLLCATAYYHSRQTAAAYELLNKTHSAKAPHTHSYLLALSAYELHKYDDAYRVLTSSLNDESASAQSSYWLLYGRIALRMSRRREAAEYFERALQLDPFQFAAFEALTALGQRSKHIAVLSERQRVLQDNLDDDGARTNETLMSGKNTVSTPAAQHPPHNNDYTTPPNHLDSLNVRSRNAMPPPPPPSTGRRGRQTPQSSTPSSTRSKNRVNPNRLVFDAAKTPQSSASTSSHTAVEPTPKRTTAKTAVAAGPAPHRRTRSMVGGATGTKKKLSEIAESGSDGDNDMQSPQRSTLSSSPPPPLTTPIPIAVDESFALSQRQSSSDSKMAVVDDEHIVDENSMTAVIATPTHSAETSITDVLQICKNAYYSLSTYDCKDAISAFQSLPQCHVTTSWVQSQLGRAYFECGEYAQSVVYYSRSHQLDPHRTSGLEYYSSALWQLKREVELSYLSQRILEYDSHSAPCWCVLGNCYSLAKDHESAIGYFRKAIQLDGAMAYAHTLCAHEYVTTEEFVSAIQSYRTAVSIDPRHYAAWYGIGHCFYRQEKFEDAIVHFRYAHNINPNSAVIDVYMAMCHIALHQHDEALALLLQSSASHPDNPQINYHLATVHLLRNEDDIALPILIRLSQSVPRESAIHWLMGKIYKRSGQLSRALMEWTIALDCDGKNSALIKNAIDKLHTSNDLDQDNEQDEIAE